MESADIKKMTVVQLRAELEDRGLDKTGNKPELITRLEEALTGSPAIEPTPMERGFEATAVENIDFTVDGEDEQVTTPVLPSMLERPLLYTITQPSISYRPIKDPSP